MNPVLMLVGLALGAAPSDAAVDTSTRPSLPQGQLLVDRFEGRGRNSLLTDYRATISGEALRVQGLYPKGNSETWVSCLVVPLRKEDSAGTLDMTHSGGEPRFGIYRWDGTQLEICWGRRRPTRFGVQREGDGLLVLRPCRCLP